MPNNKSVPLLQSYMFLPPRLLYLQIWGLIHKTLKGFKKRWEKGKNETNHKQEYLRTDQGGLCQPCRPHVSPSLQSSPTRLDTLLRDILSKIFLAFGFLVGVILVVWCSISKYITKQNKWKERRITQKESFRWRKEQLLSMMALCELGIVFCAHKGQQYHFPVQ